MQVCGISKFATVSGNYMLRNETRCGVTKCLCHEKVGLKKVTLRVDSRGAVRTQMNICEETFFAEILSA